MINMIDEIKSVLDEDNKVLTKQIENILKQNRWRSDFTKMKSGDRFFTAV